MRKLIIAAAALLAAGPAFAQPPAYDGEWDAPAAQAIDPVDVGRMAATMDRLVGAVMDLPVGGIAEALDPLGRSGYRRGDTVRDMADPAAEARIRAGIRGSAAGIGAMSEAFARMLPVLQRSIDQISRDVAGAIDQVEYHRPY